MYLHLGNGAVVRQAEVLGIFDLDSSSQSFLTREFLARQERANRVKNVSEDLPKSFVLCENAVILSPLSSATLFRRAMNNEQLTINS